MAQQLWLLRHGEAEPHDTRPDPERRLTPRGERQSVAAGRALAALGLEFAAAFTSPRVRAAETARLACEEVGVEPIAHDPLSGGFDAGDARELMAGQDADARVLVVGHEPDFSDLVQELTGGRRVVHGSEFRARERSFPGYTRARAWEKANLHLLLRQQT